MADLSIAEEKRKADLKAAERRRKADVEATQKKWKAEFEKQFVKLSELIQEKMSKKFRAKNKKLEDENKTLREQSITFRNDSVASEAENSQRVRSLQTKLQEKDRIIELLYRSHEKHLEVVTSINKAYES